MKIQPTAHNLCDNAHFQFRAEFNEVVFHMKKILIGLLCITLSSCALSVSKSTSARIRPDLTKNNDEIWEIEARGNGFMSLNKVKQNAMIRAAWTTDDEGYECFVVINDASDYEVHSFQYTTKERMNYSSHSNYNTNYYGRNYGYLGNSKSYGNTYGSYEVPVTHSQDYKKYSHIMYIRLFDEDDCDKIANTRNKWRNNVYFKDDYLQGDN